MGLAVDLRGLPEFRDIVHRMRDRLTPNKLRALGTNLGVIVMADVAKNFIGAHAPDGTPWPPLSRVTIARRRQGPKTGEKYQPRPLRDSGRTMNSVTAGGRIVTPRLSDRENPAFFSSSEGAVREVSASRFIIGTALGYPAKHQFGDAGGERVVETVQAHRRKQHRRGSYIVRPHEVRQHTRTTTTRPIPKREFLGVSGEGLRQVGEYSGDYLIGAGA